MVYWGLSLSFQVGVRLMLVHITFQTGTVASGRGRVKGGDLRMGVVEGDRLACRHSCSELALSLVGSVSSHSGYMLARARLTCCHSFRTFVSVSPRRDYMLARDVLT